MYDMLPVPDQAALVINAKVRTLVIADIHLGIEYELLKKGINLPNQTTLIKEQIERLIQQTQARKLILLGDIKHNIPTISMIESRNLPSFLNFSITCDIVKGNHDGNIETLTNNRIYQYMSIGDILLMHGHTKIPNIPFKTIVIGHSHPAVEITDELGKRSKEKCWIKGVLPEGEELVIMPAFNTLIKGISFNNPKTHIPGQLFMKYSPEKLSLNAYLLDGTFLGNVGNII